MRLPHLLHGKRRLLFARLVANGVGQAAAAVAGGLLVHALFQRVARPSADAAAAEPAGIAWMAAALAATIALSLALRVIERRDAARLGEDYVTQLRLRLFDALSATPAPGRRRSLGPTMLRFVTDLTAVRQWVSNGLARLAVSALAIAGGLAAIALIDPLGGALVTAIMGAAALAALALGGPLERRVRELRRRRARLAARIGDRLRMLSVVQMAGQARRERRSLARNSRALAEASVDRAGVVGLVRVLPDAALGLSTLSVLVLASLRLAAGDASSGAVIATLSVLGAMAPQARALGRVFEYAKTYRVATDRLRDILSGVRRARPAAAAAEIPAPADGRLAIENLSVAGALDGIEASAGPGAVVALVGPSGAGKSALLGALAGLLPLRKGRVLLGGCDLAALDGEARARAVGMASPDLPLLKGTVRRNVAYRLGKASDAEVADAIARAGLDADLARLPGGLSARVAENGANLPFGLRQRLGVARALAGDPVLLLLDEAEAGLDAEARAALDRLLARARRSARQTVILVTREPARILSADLVWHLCEGRLVEAGPPAELAVRDGPTARLLAAGRPDGAARPKLIAVND